MKRRAIDDAALFTMRRLCSACRETRNQTYPRLCVLLQAEVDRIPDTSRVPQGRGYVVTGCRRDRPARPEKMTGQKEQNHLLQRF